MYRAKAHPTGKTTTPITPRRPEFRKGRLNLIKAFLRENQEDSDIDWDQCIDGMARALMVLHLEGVEY